MKLLQRPLMLKEHFGACETLMAGKQLIYVDKNLYNFISRKIIFFK